MNNTIIFPNLHITLNNVGRSIDLFNFKIAFYGIVIAVGMLLGSYVIIRESRRREMNEDNILDVIIFSLIFGVIGARAYYVIFSWSLYRDDLLSIFNIREGGLAIYGGVIAGVITAVIVCRIKSLNFLKVADICILGLPLGQAIGRWGNFFNREAFGGYSDGLFRMQIPLNQVRSMDDVTKEMLNNSTVIKDTTFISVHPTFLYESLWCIGVFIILILLRNKIRFDGEQLLRYLLLYGLGRFWIEGLRTDQLFLWGTKIPVSQALAGVIVVLSAIILLICNIRQNKLEKQ
ncbi:MAG: prolipoprotein diacylglyceryl transferase [Lachnospiraceae bacterium]|nr:prolipoprotein diacylglyceryl transferase [Lachnospiraceae bacterium]